MRTAILALALCLSPSLAHAYCDRAVTPEPASMSPLQMLAYLDDAASDGWDEASENDIVFHAVVSLGAGHYLVDVTDDLGRHDYTLIIPGPVTEEALFDAFDRAFYR